MRRFGGTLATLAAAHAAVDATCAALLAFAAATGRLPVVEALAWYLVYNVAAFALQPLLGLGIDATGRARGAAIAGALLTAAALPLSLTTGAIRAAVLLAGLGNALFHVGGGAISLRIEPGRAWAPGVFVAPGAAGLALGVWLGHAGVGVWWPAAVLVALALPLALAPLPSLADTPPRRSAHARRDARAEVAVALVLLVVMARSLTGFAIPMAWKAQLPLLVAATTAVVLGKAIGGLFADRYGRLPVGVGALVLSAPVLVFAPASPLAGVLGLFAFNMTMPVTLVALADTVPAYPGFAFGMASLAIVVGAFPLLAGAHVDLSGWAGTLGVGWGAAAVLAVALVWLSRRDSAEKPVVPTVMEVAK